uniref:Uncharacterized protein n=1 Tax=Anguilla anguilla TaxID=7936 RepID=A0A0E9TBA6_ANGAN
MPRNALVNSWTMRYIV